MVIPMKDTQLRLPEGANLTLMASICLSVKHSSKLQVLTNIQLGLK